MLHGEPTGRALQRSGQGPGQQEPAFRSRPPPTARSTGPEPATGRQPIAAPPSRSRHRDHKGPRKYTETLRQCLPAYNLLTTVSALSISPTVRLPTLPFPSFAPILRASSSPHAPDQSTDPRCGYLRTTTAQVAGKEQHALRFVSLLALNTTTHLDGLVTLEPSLEVVVRGGGVEPKHTCRPKPLSLGPTYLGGPTV